METAEKTIASAEGVGAVSMSPSTSLLAVSVGSLIAGWDGRIKSIADTVDALADAVRGDWRLQERLRTIASDLGDLEECTANKGIDRKDGEQ